MTSRHQDIGRITLTVLFIGGLIAASFRVMQPFLPAILWATTLVIATWPLLLWVQRHTGNRRAVAVLVMTAATVLTLIIPLWLAVSTVVTNLDVIGDLVRTVLSLRLPPPPDWLVSLPIVGASAANAWAKLQSAGVQDFLSRLAPYAGELTQWFATAAGGLGSMFVHLVLTTAIAAVMYAGGERAAGYVVLFGRRLAGDRGEAAVHLAGQAIKSVALGVVVTAFAQSVLGGIGLAVVGIQFVGLLTALMFVLCLIQMGPALVLVPAVIWLYYSGDAFWATILLAFAFVATTIDQLIRPILIRRGAALPLLLVFAGVVGGLVAFGFLGIFIGPTVLAVTYTLLNAWIAEGNQHEAVYRQDASGLPDKAPSPYA
ncbi:AI-2E family transporter YdiK [Mesorhizobium marinum]|uniref:AI-2E family transporter YdiK n=1 Tax=Mesorhizobium marinum TaxID=3228790 RepID=UPI003466BE92